MLEQLLQEHDIEPSQVIKVDREHLVPLDLSKDNQALAKIDLNDEDAFSNFIFDQLKEKQVGYGGYGEERALYSRSDLFEGEEPRTIHLGIDLWTDAGTPVYAPLDGVVHSFDNRAFHGDYGPVIILAHQLGAHKLFSLYGHLSQSSLEGKSVGQSIQQGEQFAWLGTYEENFHWPPHLHFQLMWDLQGNQGDYPGVAKASEANSYLTNCPDPKYFF
jgi:murein DD-endopeptidase MepM/ murein hydrolase activator NlpD